MQEGQALSWEGDRGSLPLCQSWSFQAQPWPCFLRPLLEPLQSEPSELMCKQGAEEPDGL